MASPTPFPSPREWLSLWAHRWTEVFRDRTVSTILAVGAAVLAIGAYLLHITWGPQIVVGCVTVAWAIIAAPIAAYRPWHDERMARIAAEEAASAKTPDTLRAVTFELSRDIRAWLRALPENPNPHDDARLVRDGFNAQFRARTLAVWDRLDVALFPKRQGLTLDLYMSVEETTRRNVRTLANDLEIFVNRAAADFPAK